MRHVVFLGKLSTFAGNQLFDVMKDWTLSGLVQESNWLDPRKPDEIINLGINGSKTYDLSAWSTSMIRAEEQLELFSLQLLISKDGAMTAEDLAPVFSKLGTHGQSSSKLVNILFPTFGNLEGLQESCFAHNQNVIASPTDAHSPLTGTLQITRKSHQYFQHAAKELSSMAGIWPGQTARTVPEGNVSPGNTSNIRLARSFIRYVDASSLVDEITGEVLSTEPELIPVAFDPDTKAPLERVSLGESENQIAAVAANFLGLFPGLTFSPPPAKRLPKADEAGIIEAIKLYFKWVFGWLRKQPKQLLQGFIHDKKVKLAEKVQETFGGSNSRIAVYVGNVTAHGGQEWDSFDVTKSIQEVSSRHVTEKLAPASPGQIWQVFFKAATALADGKDATFQGAESSQHLELPRFQKGGRRLISNPSHIVSDPASGSFSIPVGLPLRFSGYRLTSEDPLLFKVALDEIRETLSKGEELSVSEKTKLIELEDSLEAWAKTNVSFTWLVGSALSEGIHSGLYKWDKVREAISANVDGSKVAEAEAKAQAALKNLFRGGLAITLTALGLLGGSAIWTLIATGAFPLIGATWWIPVAIFSSIFAIWNLVAGIALSGAIKEYFALDNNLTRAENQYKRAKEQESHIWGEIHRLTSYYQQYMYWCRILSPVIHRVQPKEARASRTSVINSVHKLPAAMSVAKLMPNEGNTGDMTAQVKRDFYRPGWIEDSFARITRRVNVNLTDLYNDDANLEVGPLATLAKLFSTGDEIAKMLDQDASARVQEISTSGPSYQKWRVEPLGMIGQHGIDSGSTFILELTKGNVRIPDGDILSARGQVNGSNDLDENLTYFAADSRIVSNPELNVEELEKITPNPLHPLDFLGVRVEISKPFATELLNTNTEGHSDIDPIEMIERPEA
jgi:hypothetical protein